MKSTFLFLVSFIASNCYSQNVIIKPDSLFVDSLNNGHLFITVTNNDNVDYCIEKSSILFEPIVFSDDNKLCQPIVRIFRHADSIRNIIISRNQTKTFEITESDFWDSYYDSSKTYKVLYKYVCRNKEKCEGLKTLKAEFYLDPVNITFAKNFKIDFDR